VILVEDSPRNNVVSWTIAATQDGIVDGVILAPFSTPWVNNNYKRGIADTIRRLRDGGVEQIWIDVTTHALQMPNCGDFRYYDSWDLFSDIDRRLTDSAEYRDHLRRVFDIQDHYEVPRLAPTLLLHNPASQTSQRALEIARHATEMSAADGVEVALTIAGTSAFWAGGNALDAHIGGVAQMLPNYWFLAPVRPVGALPAPVEGEEIHGICRTARSLSDEASIHVSHGDLAALPAVAAGAASIGTGWDTRQRAQAYDNYVERTGGEGGSWLQRLTLQGLYGTIARQEAELLQAGDAALSARLVPGRLPPQGAQETWHHHARSLRNLMQPLLSASTYDSAYDLLMDGYSDARGNWVLAEQVVTVATDYNSWVRPLQRGLSLYGQTEGF
jgi:hypothetical protein